MTDHSMQSNPLCIVCPDPKVGAPLAELKQHLVLFVDSPPGPKTARAVYDLYFRTWSDTFRTYSSTAFGKMVQEWSPVVRRHFETDELPDLRKYENWGYVFSDNQKTDSRLFMFHGYHPFSESGKASFYRFEFEWQLDSRQLLAFTQALLGMVNCVSGYGGYVFQGQPRGPYGRSSFDQIYRLARRYWGVEVQNLDVTVNHMLDGYKCPSWLTVLGNNLPGNNPTLLASGEAVAFRTFHMPGGTIFQAGPQPILGDRNRREPLDVYEAIANALEPIQVKTHGAFGGTLWTEESTSAWLHRFSDPNGFK